MSDFFRDSSGALVFRAKKEDKELIQVKNNKKKEQLESVLLKKQIEILLDKINNLEIRLGKLEDANSSISNNE